MVGTGVFTSLGFQVADLPSAFVILSLWMLGGVVALSGALSYAELAAALPRSGGEYHFLSRIFHPALGFLAGWTSATVGFAAPIALSAMAFGTYAKAFAPGVSPLLLSLALVWGTSAVHFTGLRRGSAFQNWFTFLKVALIVAFIVAGFVVRPAPAVSFLPAQHDWRLMTGSAFAIALVFVMYSYSGWNASTYIVSEIRDPKRNVPRSVFLGTLAVLVLYVALNAAFLRTTPMPAMAGQLEVGLIAGRQIFGGRGRPGGGGADLPGAGLVGLLDDLDRPARHRGHGRGPARAWRSWRSRPATARPGWRWGRRRSSRPRCC